MVGPANNGNMNGNANGDVSEDGSVKIEYICPISNRKRYCFVRHYPEVLLFDWTGYFIAKDALPAMMESTFTAPSYNVAQVTLPLNPLGQTLPLQNVNDSEDDENSPVSTMQYWHVGWESMAAKTYARLLRREPLPRPDRVRKGRNE